MKSGRILSSIGIIDTGPLIAAADVREPSHEACIDLLGRGDLHPIVPALVVAEASFIIQRRLGSPAESQFVRSLADWEIEAPTPQDMQRMAELLTDYADLGLGATDASVIALAERHDTGLIVTLDRRQFSVVRPGHVDSFELLPEA